MSQNNQEIFDIFFKKNNMIETILQNKKNINYIKGINKNTLNQIDSNKILFYNFSIKQKTKINFQANININENLKKNMKGIVYVIITKFFNNNLKPNNGDRFYTLHLNSTKRNDSFFIEKGNYYIKWIYSEKKLVIPFQFNLKISNLHTLNLNLIVAPLNNSTTNTTTNSTINNTVNSTINTTTNSTINSAINNTVNSTTNSAINNTVNNTVNSTTNYTINSAINNTVNSTINNTVNSTTNSTINSAINNTVNSTINTETSPINNAVNSSINTETTANIILNDLTNVIKPKKYAVVIGINDYKFISDLQGCRNDAIQWCNYLKNKGYEILLYGDTPKGTYFGNYIITDLATEQNVRSGIQYIVKILNKDDTLCIINSGHGSRYDSKTLSFLCMIDCANGPNGQYTDIEMESDLKDVVSKGAKLILFFDACSSGGFLDNVQNIDQNKGQCVALSTCNILGYGYDVPQIYQGAWTYVFLNRTLMIENPINITDAFYKAMLLYPFTGNDAPQMIGNGKIMF